MVKFFWDSYAIIELLKGNSNYAKYSNEPFILSIFNLVEVYWSVLNEKWEKEAENIYNLLKDAVIEIEDNILKEAVKFRKEHKKRDLSYADCIGYVYAKSKEMKFLTGDKEFSEMQFVEFVK